MIEFRNAGCIDPRSITTFGVSVKEGSNPIGFFGTGLKYAIAVLLRNKQTVTIYSGLTCLQFSAQDETIRGQVFGLVHCATDGGQPAPCGFTTDLGKGWDLWMAYRELSCNCKDEAGTEERVEYPSDPTENTTIVAVAGAEFNKIFGHREDYILQDTAVHTSAEVEVRNRSSVHAFYRTIAVGQLEKPAKFTYNFIRAMDLTEDRTLKYSYYIKPYIARCVLASQNKSFILQCLMAHDSELESDLDFNVGVEPSYEFIEVVEDCIVNRKAVINKTAHDLWISRNKKAAAPKAHVLTPVQDQMLAKALAFCTRIGFPIATSGIKINFCESLGPNILGLADQATGEIYIAERAFHLGGAKQLASTLIEEYLHSFHGWADMSREMQSFLFDKVVSLGEELQGHPL